MTDSVAFYSERDLDKMGVLSRNTRYRMRLKGDFPPPVKLCAGRVAYPAKVIDNWIAERAGDAPAAA